MTEPNTAGAPGDSYPSPGSPVPPVTRRRRTGLIVVLLLGGTLLLCVGGGVAGYLLVLRAQPPGSADPAAAVDGFLTAVFANHDEAEAADYVCPAARDSEQLGQLVDRVVAFEDRLAAPRTTWDEPAVQISGGKATATVRLTLTTELEQVAEKRIRLLLVDQRGWWVCDVEAVG